MLRRWLHAMFVCLAVAGCSAEPEPYRSASGFEPVSYDGGLLLDLQDRGGGVVETVDKTSGMTGVVYTRRVTFCGTRSSRVTGAGYTPFVMDRSAGDPTMSTLIAGTSAMELGRLACLIVRRPLTS